MVVGRGGLPSINYKLSTTFLHFYTAIFHDGEAPSLREGRAPARPLPRCRFWSRQARPSRVGQRSQRTATLPRRPAVAEDCDPPASANGRRDCDPPASASGRRGARPSRVGQRSQRTATLPRHVAMAPSPSYLPASCRDIMCWQLATVATSATLPRYARRRGRTPLATACAAHFVRGICRYYTAIFHDGEAPSLREGRAPARPLPRCRFRSSGRGTRSRASAFSSMRSLVRRPCQSLWPSGLEQVSSEGDRGRLGAVRGAELGEDGVDLLLDSVEADVQHLGDVQVG